MSSGLEEDEEEGQRLKSLPSTTLSESHKVAVDRHDLSLPSDEAVMVEQEDGPLCKYDPDPKTTARLLPHQRECLLTNCSKRM